MKIFVTIHRIWRYLYETTAGYYRCQSLLPQFIRGNPCPFSYILSIYKNVLLGLEIRRELTAEKLAYVNQLLSDYGLDKFRSAHPSELSGGMRQRAALIRTLALKPELLLLDEPFSALDSQTRLSVSDDIGRILRQEKKTAILVTHDISEAISMADRVIILSPRPAIIRKIVPVCFDLENRTPMASRNAPEFKSYFNLIWKELNQYA